MQTTTVAMSGDPFGSVGVTRKATWVSVAATTRRMRPTTGTGMGVTETGPATGEFPAALPEMPDTSYGVPLASPSTMQKEGVPSGWGSAKQFHTWPVAGSTTVAANAATCAPSGPAVKPTTIRPDCGSAVSAGAIVGAREPTALCATRKSCIDAIRV